MAEGVKACVFCEHCEINKGFMGSEWTGWISGSTECLKNHWRDMEPDDGEVFLIAQQCDDFELKSELASMLRAREETSCD